MAQPPRPDLAAIREAAARIKPFVHRTPVLTCQALNDLAQGRLFFKCENFQKAGAFKARGAANAVWSLDEAEARKGVATHSSGNHAAALALAARNRGVPAYIVMPETTPAPKRAAVAGYGGRIILCAPTMAAREEAARRVLAETGAVLVHPYNDHRVMAGQGTAALELLEEVPDLEAVIAPVGGGGLLAGTALAATGLKPGIAVIGAEPQAADDAWRSLQEGRIFPSVTPRTIADGLTTPLGELTFPVLKERVARIVTVAEEAIVSAMRLVWERMKIVVEPSAAVAVAAVLDPAAGLAGRRVGLILSGGNVDLDKLPWVQAGAAKPA